MTGEWKTVKLGEITSFITKGIPPKYVETETDETIRVLNQKCNRNFTISYAESRLHDNAAKKVADDKMLKSGDVLINSTGMGTAGRVAQIWDIPTPTTIDGHMILIRPTEAVDTLYFGYAIKTFQKTIEGYAEGSTGQTEINRSRLLKEIELSLPPLDVQRRIAAVLKPLDDKIELNGRINTRLERVAQALFKRHFVRFEPYGGTMPAGWRVGTLSEIAEYLNGLAMQKFRPKEGEIGIPVLKIKELRQGVCDENSELCSPNINRDYIVHDGDVIFSWSGTLLVDFWCGGECGLNQHLFKVTSKEYDKWFYYSWTKHHLRKFVAMAADMATTMGHIKREALDNSEVLIPTQEDYAEIGNVMRPLFDMIIENRRQSRALARLRDVLLPRLMSGAVDVGQVYLNSIQEGGSR